MHSDEHIAHKCVKLPADLSYSIELRDGAGVVLMHCDFLSVKKFYERFAQEIEAGVFVA